LSGASYVAMRTTAVRRRRGNAFGPAHCLGKTTALAVFAGTNPMQMN
jgi:hypothetical protein